MTSEDELIMLSIFMSGLIFITTPYGKVDAKYILSVFAINVVNFGTLSLMYLGFKYIENKIKKLGES
jgi:hypothetical protein